jgi:hypothetical protein
MVDNTRIFGFEVQHIFPTAIVTQNTPEAVGSRRQEKRWRGARFCHPPSIRQSGPDVCCGPGAVLC